MHCLVLIRQVVRMLKEIDFCKDMGRVKINHLEFRHSIVVSISPCHGDDRGSIPRVGTSFSFANPINTIDVQWQKRNCTCSVGIIAYHL